MPNRYVKSTGSNTAPYDTWATAATDPATAINAAAAGETVYVFAESYTIAANTTWTLAGSLTSPVSVICVSDTAEPPTTLGSAKYTQNANNDLAINGIGYVYGFSLESTQTTVSPVTLTLAATDGDDVILENGGLLLPSGNTASTSGIIIGAASESNSQARLINPTVTLGNAIAQSILAFQPCVIDGGTVSSVASLTSLLKISGRSGSFRLDGVDLSGVSGTIVNPASQPVGGYFELRNFKHNASATLVGAYTDVAQPDVWLSNYSSGDVHYNYAHYSSRGSTIMETGIYANDGQTYDGTNPITWKITTSGYASTFMPYVSPWIEKYHAGTSAITPYFEILRDGSTTPYTNKQVWAEFSFQGTSGSTKASFANDEGAILSAASDQNAGVGVAGWTGDTGAWSGKIDSGAAITPAEIGTLRGRVYVGAPSITVYVDPKIRT